MSRARPRRDLALEQAPRPVRAGPPMPPLDLHYQEALAARRGGQHAVARDLLAFHDPLDPLEVERKAEQLYGWCPAGTVTLEECEEAARRVLRGGKLWAG